jgi:hypothetical protein
MFNHINLPKSMWQLIFDVVDVIFKFGSPKRKSHKSIWIMPHVKLSKNMFLGQKNWRKKKIATHMDLWKYGQILTIQKSLIIK